MFRFNVFKLSTQRIHLLFVKTFGLTSLLHTLQLLQLRFGRRTFFRLAPPGHRFLHNAPLPFLELTQPMHRPEPIQFLLYDAESCTALVLLTSVTLRLFGVVFCFLAL
eukprot:PhM_4_TR16347/c0_g1_i1/m.56396